MSETPLYQAFAPNGHPIVATYEVTDGSQAISGFFFDDEDERYRHEFSGLEAASLGDASTVTQAGKVVYMDAKGGYWPEPALTIKDATGFVVRKGMTGLLPIQPPDLEGGMETLLAIQSIKAQATALATERGLGADAVRKVRSILDQSSGVLNGMRARVKSPAAVDHLRLEAFVRDLGLMDAYAAYVLLDRSGQHDIDRQDARPDADAGAVEAMPRLAPRG